MTLRHQKREMIARMSEGCQLGCGLRAEKGSGGRAWRQRVTTCPYLRTVGLRVRLLRVGLGWSLKELPVVCGVSRVTVGSIERGDRLASVLAYRKLARAFEISLDELLDERDPRSARPHPG